MVDDTFAIELLRDQEYTRLDSVIHPSINASLFAIARLTIGV